jgi:hypothetical protein
MHLSITKIETVLEKILQAINESKQTIEFRLIGTAAAMIKGVSIQTADIDLLAHSRKDVDIFCKIFENYMDTDSTQWIDISILPLLQLMLLKLK